MATGRKTHAEETRRILVFMTFAQRDRMRVPKKRVKCCSGLHVITHAKELHVLTLVYKKKKDQTAHIILLETLIQQ